MWRLVLSICIVLLLLLTVKQSRRIEHFEDAAPVPLATPIPGFVIPPSVVPKKPPPSANSNGGLVSIG